MNVSIHSFNFLFNCLIIKPFNNSFWASLIYSITNPLIYSFHLYYLWIHLLITLFIKYIYIHYWAGWYSSNLYSGRARFESRPGYHDWKFSLLYSVPSGKFQAGTAIRPLPFLSKSFPIQYSPVVLPFDAIPAASLRKPQTLYRGLHYLSAHFHFSTRPWLIIPQYTPPRDCRWDAAADLLPIIRQPFPDDIYFAFRDIYWVVSRQRYAMTFQLPDEAIKSVYSVKSWSSDPLNLGYSSWRKKQQLQKLWMLIQNEDEAFHVYIHS
jgi:hypothetical protein